MDSQALIEKLALTWLKGQDMTGWSAEDVLNAYWNMYFDLQSKSNTIREDQRRKFINS